MYTVYTFNPSPLDMVLNRTVQDGKILVSPVGKKIKTYKTFLAAYDRMAKEQYTNTENAVIYVIEDSSSIVMHTCNGLN